MIFEVLLTRSCSLDSATNLGTNANLGQLAHIVLAGNTQTSSSVNTPDISSILSHLGVSANADGSIDRRELLSSLGNLGTLGAGAGSGFDLSSLGLGDLSGGASTDADASGTSTSSSTSGGTSSSDLLSGLDLGSLVGSNSNLGLGANFGLGAADKRQITNGLGFGGNVGVGSGLDINALLSQILGGNFNAGASASASVTASDSASISATATATGTASIPTGTISLTPTTATAGASTTATANTNGFDLNSILSGLNLGGGNFGSLGGNANANVGANTNLGGLDLSQLGL